MFSNFREFLCILCQMLSIHLAGLHMTIDTWKTVKLMRKKEGHRIRKTGIS